MKIKFSQRTFISFIILFIIAIFYTYGFIKHYQDESIWVDGYGYLMGGWWLIEEHSFTLRLMKTQAYIPALIIGIFQQISDPYFAGKLMNYVYMLLSIVVVYLLGRELKDENAGYFASAVFLSIPVVYYLFKRSLVDFPLAVMYGFTTYFYIRYLKERSLKYAVLTGITAGFTLLTKSAGIFVIGIIGLHLLITQGKKAFYDKHNYWLIGSYFLTVAPLIIMNLLRFKKPIVAPNSFTAIAFKAPDYLYYLRLETIKYYASFPLFLLGMYGLYWLWKKHRSVAYYVLMYVLLYGFAFSIVKYQDPRFFTPISLIVALLSGVALSVLYEGESLIRKSFTLLILVIIVVWNVSDGELLVLSKSNAYTGYRDLEPYFLKEGNNNSMAFVSSEWTMEFVTREFYDNPLRQVDNLPKNFEDLQNYVNECLNHYEVCYLQIDFWEPTQPSYVSSWINELRQHYKGMEEDIVSLPTIQKLESLGFELVKVVYRNVGFASQQVKIPVVLLFEIKK
ncbi:MAG: phospholipid carrier-dependent glycosyltransferase [Candidatus Nanohaloarchaeota archaeon]|nr:phospholipid carrier-dependent glycosyltransferase [Candidatus Nanohaloarchaeota archaeon]